MSQLPPDLVEKIMASYYNAEETMNYWKVRLRQANVTSLAPQINTKTGKGFIHIDVSDNDTSHFPTRVPLVRDGVVTTDEFVNIVMSTNVGGAIAC